MFTIDKTFSYGRKTVLITIPVPMCKHHFEKASQKSKAEKLCERGGLVGGILIGLISFSGLLMYWASTNQGNSIFNIILGLFVGVSLFLIVWAGAVFWLAPSFALPESKQIRKNVSITKYWLADDVMELSFENEAAAEQFIANNPHRIC
jgi:hypothetical protein